MQGALNAKVAGSSPARPTQAHNNALIYGLVPHLAGVAELEDAQGLGPCGSDPVEVRVLSPAPDHGGRGPRGTPVMILAPRRNVR